ncbi:MAG TPA: murein biosynthesis integral membrane protein MurJ [Chthoniobacteraceae bacterium]|jgi:putative peptidoglycan lipid II flippase|nr:murein biosynthesis integral membrane protein MurJ [Chthoniobacteraceae bacterium]
MSEDPKIPAPAAAATPPVTASRRISARSAGVVGLAVMCSRVLGLARELILAKLFGAGFGMDAFVSAFRVPNLLRDLFAEGALSTAFVTTFSQKIQQEGDGAAWRLANKVATMAVVTISLLTLLGMLLAPQLIGLLAGGFPPEKQALIIQLTRIMFPFIIMVSLAALVMGMLNAKNVFGVPAMASSFFNLGSILGGVTLAWWLDPHFGPWALVGLSIGTLIGGGLQLAVQFPALWKVGFRYRPDFHWDDPGVRQVLRLMGPAVIAASAVQVNVMINGRFASELPGDGPASWLAYAFRLMQLPLGIFGVAIGTVTLPLVARAAAAGNKAEFRSALAHGMRLAFLLTIPSTVGLIMLARPIISVIYERGKFTALSTDQTAGALQCYALGLAAYSGIKVLAPAFYALDKRHTPMIVSFVSIATNLLLNYVLTFQMGLGHRGLALSTGIVAMINFGALYYLMHRETKVLETRQMIVSLLKILAASALLAVVCWAGDRWVLGGWTHFGLAARIGGLLLVIGVGAVAFFGAALGLRVGEMDDVAKLIRRRLKRS